MAIKKYNFTEEQINEMIELHNSGMLHKHIAEKFNTSRSTIDRTLQNTDLPSRHPLLSEERKDRAYELYMKYRDLNKVGAELHMSNKTVSEIVKAKGFKIDMSEIKQIYDINQEYFDVIDTQEKAYYLGLLAADGTVGSKTNVVQITLQERDKYLLELLRDAIKSNHNILKLNYQSRKKTYQNQYQFSVMNKHMHDSLISHGIVPRKSYCLEFPKDLAPELYSSFLRGYMDGDGTIAKAEKRVRLVSTESFCLSVQKILKDTLDINSHIIHEKRDPNRITCTLGVAGGIQTKIFLNWIYKDATVFLKRKYEIYKTMYCN